MHLSRFIPVLLLGCATAVLAQGAPSPRDDSDVVLAENAHAKLTVRDYRAELLNLPPEMRDAFATDPKRIAALLNNLLALKTLAAQAREAGVDRQPDFQRRLALENERFLAQVQVQRLEEKYGAEFDARLPELTARARELYLLDRAKYTSPPQIDVSHILFAKSRGDEAALAAAREARSRLESGADFAELARTLSDDAGSKANGGHIGWRAQGQLDPAFEKAAFALQKPGEISAPVASSFGYHLIKLEGKRPASTQSFDEVKAQILADMRTQYINEHREAALAAIRNDPGNKPNQPAIDALVQRPASGSAAR